MATGSAAGGTLVWKMIYRWGIYVLGLLVMAWGIAFSVNSNLGVSPANSLPYAVSRVVGHGDPIPYLGLCVNIVLLFFIAVQALILRREFKLKNLLQFVFATIFGRFVDLTKYLLGDFTIPTYAGSLAMLAISILLIGLGIALFLAADIVPVPVEALAMLIATKYPQRWPYHRIKVVMDCGCAVLAAVVSLLFFGDIAGLREGTFITAVLVGPTVRLFSRFVWPLVRRPLLGPAAPEGPVAEPQVSVK